MVAHVQPHLALQEQHPRVDQSKQVSQTHDQHPGADSGEEVGVQAEGGKKRKVGKGRFGGGSSSARGK